jgi:septal ring factor EnvC (AmiA/AmiB activator)
MKVETRDKKREILLLRAEIEKLKSSIASAQRYNEWLRDQLMLAETAIRNKDYIIMKMEKEHDSLRKSFQDLLGDSTKKQKTGVGSFGKDVSQTDGDAPQSSVCV